MTYDDRTRTNDRPLSDDRPRANAPSNISPGEYREDHTHRSEYTLPQTINARIDYHDLVRWGPIIAGIVITIASQLILSSLGLAIGFTIGAAGADTDPGDIGLGVGIWSIISLFIALFIGAWLMARTCGPMNKRTALLNGAVLWAASLVLSGWLLASGVTGTFGMAISGANAIMSGIEQPANLDIPEAPGEAVPDLPPAQVERYVANAAQASWSFLFGALLGLVAALIGATAGARKPRVHNGDVVR